MKDGWIIKEGKDLKVVCGGSSASERETTNTAPGEVEGTPVLVMRDTGCTHCISKEKPVPNEKVYRLMRELFGDLNNVETFFDDILIHTETWDEHCALLQEVLKPLFFVQMHPVQGLGAVLLQEHDNEKWPVFYASRKLSEVEQRYAVIERECLAVVWATKKFYPYLYGKQFILETDHRPLTYLDTAKPLNGRLMRWALHLQQFQMSIHYIKGSDNVGGDYLSRL
ncbi:uncharacterized protein LOC135224778 [Macrobrachium nipponense]|uniref:uncharacterized protein LOC135224778 n=1 Tax=Macrobrachium nipponense TaxID=159736 RepID=UPI0030C835FD